MEKSGNNALNKSSQPPVAVIILNWNGEKLLREFLPSVVEHSDSKVSRIIVADNGSADDSLALLEKEFGNAVELIRFPENYGFAEGYNRAIATCSDYEYVVLLNSDVAVTDGWDSALYRYMEMHPETGACQPKILSYRKREYFEYAGACGGFLDCDGYPYCRGRIFDVCERDKGQYDSEMELFWASGACLMVRRNVYMDCGGLDRDFFAHMEEIDLCWRIRLAGYAVAAVPSARVYHLGGGSLPAENPKKTYLNFRNNLLMLHKNLPDDDRRPALLRRRLLDTIAWMKYVVTLDFANAKAIFKAHRDFAVMRKKYTTHPDVNLLRKDRYSQLSVLVARFLKGKTRFEEL